MSDDIRSEEVCLDFLDSAEIGLHWGAADGTIRWANAADYGPLGYSADEYVGHNIVEFHADAEVIRDMLRRLSAGERLRNYAARLRCKDGSIRNVLVTSSAKFDQARGVLLARFLTIEAPNPGPDGDLNIRMEGLRREVERLTLLASRERGLIESILTVSPHGIIVSDGDGKLVLQNKAAEKIWAGSASAEDIAGWQKYRGFHADGRPYQGSDWAMARCLLLGETVQPEETRILRFDNSPAVLLGGAAPIRGSGGEVQGAVAVFADVTRFKQAEEETRLSAERYFTTLKSIGDGVIATDAQRRITFLNPVAEKLTQWTHADANGRLLAEVFHIVNEHTRVEIESPVEKVMRDGNVVGLANDAVLIGKLGTEIAIDDCGAPIFDKAGALAGVVLVFRDVTDKRRDEHRRHFLIEASSLLASSLEYGPTLSMVAKLAVPTIADWCAVDVVERGGALTRLAVEHADPEKLRLAKELESRFPPDPASPYGVHNVVRSGQAVLLSEISDALLADLALDDEHHNLLRSLGLKSAMIVPLRARGRTVGALTFVAAESRCTFGPNDVSFAEELANCAALAVDNATLYREAQQASRAKDEFLANVSHELRTPLNAILGWASLLQTPDVATEKRALGLATIERNARAQAQLIEDLLDVSRIISGQLRLELIPTNLAAVVEAAVESLRPAAHAKGVRLELRIDHSVGDVIGDPARLQQVLWNLLSNGVKFTPRGGTVTVRLYRSESEIELQVIDTGMGIEPKFLPHVFERFKQANATTSRASGGLGLGLAIVRHLVELHGGTVSVESAGPGAGSAFRVRLPVPVRGQAVPNAGAASSSAPSPVAPSLGGLRVLLVDDQEDARTLLAEILQGHGAEVTAVASVAEALREIHVNPPDLLVSDIGMPGEDGYSLIRKVRALTKGRRPLPAVALTAYARTEDRTRALMAGFQSHVAKPVEPEELLMVVAALAGRTG